MGCWTIARTSSGEFHHPAWSQSATLAPPRQDTTNSLSGQAWRESASAVFVGAVEARLLHILTDVVLPCAQYLATRCPFPSVEIVFHERCPGRSFACIRQWSKSSNTCPMCKARFTRIAPAPPSATTATEPTSKTKKQKRPRQPRAVSVRHRDFAGGGDAVPQHVLEAALLRAGGDGGFFRSHIGNGMTLGHLGRIMRMVPEASFLSTLFHSASDLLPVHLRLGGVQMPEVPVSRASAHHEPGPRHRNSSTQAAAPSARPMARAAAPGIFGVSLPARWPGPSDTAQLYRYLPDEDDDDDDDWMASRRRSQTHSRRHPRSSARGRDRQDEQVEVIELDMDDGPALHAEQLRRMREAEFDPNEVTDLLSEDEDGDAAAAAAIGDDEIIVLDSDSDDNDAGVLRDSALPPRITAAALVPPSASSLLPSSLSSASSSSSAAAASSSAAGETEIARGRRGDSGDMEGTPTTATSSSSPSGPAHQSTTVPSAVCSRPAAAAVAAQPAGAAMKRMRAALAASRDSPDNTTACQENAFPPRVAAGLPRPRQAARAHSLPVWAASALPPRESVAAGQSAASAAVSASQGDGSGDTRGLPQVLTAATAARIVPLGEAVQVDDGAPASKRSFRRRVSGGRRSLRRTSAV